MKVPEIPPRSRPLLNDSHAFWILVMIAEALLLGLRLDDAGDAPPNRDSLCLEGLSIRWMRFTAQACGIDSDLAFERAEHDDDGSDPIQASVTDRLRSLDSPISVDGYHGEQLALERWFYELQEAVVEGAYAAATHDPNAYRADASSWRYSVPMRRLTSGAEVDSRSLARAVHEFSSQIDVVWLARLDMALAASRCALSMLNWWDSRCETDFSPWGSGVEPLDFWQVLEFESWLTQAAS